MKNPSQGPRKGSGAARSPYSKYGKHPYNYDAMYSKHPHLRNSRKEHSTKESR